MRARPVAREPHRLGDHRRHRRRRCQRPRGRERDEHDGEPCVARHRRGTKRRAPGVGDHHRCGDRQWVDREIRHLQRQIGRGGAGTAAGDDQRRALQRDGGEHQCGAPRPSIERRPDDAGGGQDDERPAQRARRRPDREPHGVHHVEAVHLAGGRVDRRDDRDRDERDRQMGEASPNGKLAPRAHDHHEGQDERPDPDRPGQESGHAEQREQRHRAGGLRLPRPHQDRPPHRDREQLRHDLRDERLFHERAGEERVRQPQQQRGDDGERHARYPVGHQPTGDEKDEPALERRGQRDDRVQGVQRVAVEPRAGEHGQQVGARRVVDHLAEIRAEDGLVRQPPVLFEVSEEGEMMGEIRAGPGREEVGARPPHQPGERAGRQDRKGRGRRPVGRRAPLQPPPDGAGGGESQRQDREG